MRGEIVALDEPRLLAWTWGEERYSFALEPDDACLLVFTHVFDDRYGPAAQHAAGWEAYFDRLEAHVTGGQLSEEDRPCAHRQDARALRRALRPGSRGGQAHELDDAVPRPRAARLRCELARVADRGPHALDRMAVAAREPQGRRAWDRCFARLDVLLAGQTMSEEESLAELAGRPRALREDLRRRLGARPKGLRRAPRT